MMVLHQAKLHVHISSGGVSICNQMAYLTNGIHTSSQATNVRLAKWRISSFDASLLQVVLELKWFGQNVSQINVAGK